MTQQNAFILAIGILFTFAPVIAQAPQQITHLRGTKIINGISVKVTSSGKVDSLQYCGTDTWPYYMGYNYVNTGCADGSYMFTFSSPVKEAYINLSALSHSLESYNEEARIFVNDHPYKVKSLGSKNGCGEELAFITPEGNIRPCKDCSGSGTKGIKITGPINTLRIECKILQGEPMGFVASVFISGKSNNETTLVNYTATLAESPAGMGKELVIESGQLEDAEIILKDSQQNMISIRYRTIERDRVVIDASELGKGEYWLEIKLNNEVEKQKLLID